MKTTLTLILALLFTSCNYSLREGAITDGDSTNISPNQQISPEESAKKDSTSRDLLDRDTTREAHP